MSSIFAGLLIVMIDFNFTVNDSVIELLPDFIGYFLIFRGLGILNGESEEFGKAKPWTIGMIAFSATIYVLDLFGAASSMGVFAYIVSLTATVIFLYILHIIIKGMLDIETKRSCNLNAEQLKNVWLTNSIVQVAAFGLNIIPKLALISLVIAFISNIVILILFSKSTKLYNKLDGSTK